MPSPAEPRTDPVDDATDSLFVEEQRFSIVPEWVIGAGISDAGFRLYTLLLRYGGSSGCRMPSRSTLARRSGRSVDSVDRAMHSLVDAGVVRVERRRDGRQNLTNRYHVLTSDPTLAQTPRSGGGRTSAATPQGPDGGGRNSAATPGRTSAARVAADLRPDPEPSTETPPPPARAGSALARRAEVVGREVLEECDITDLNELAALCAAARRSLGRSETRWSAACLLPVIAMAVRHRGWPAHLVAPALLAVAADPRTVSPMRVAEAGPWWDIVAPSSVDDDEGLDQLEARLAATDGLRVSLQAAARRELAAEGLPVVRASVLRRACELLDRREAG